MKTVLITVLTLLTTDDSIEVRGPCGGFEYEANTLDYLIVLASGGGVTPGLQLIRSIMANPKDETTTLLIYYAENAIELIYKSELDKYASTDNRIKIVYSLGEPPKNWDGEEGFIDQDMLARYLPKRCSSTKKKKIVLCGGATMVINCIHALRNMEYSSEDIFVFGQFGAEQIRSVYGKNAQLSGHRSTDGS